jgi:hypothetical protein
MKKRETYRTKKGKKMYRVRGKDGRIKDNQSYAKSSRADQRKKHTKSDRKASSKA